MSVIQTTKSTKQKQYYIGCLWFLMSLVIGALNDVLTKYNGLVLPSYQVTFLRLSFGVLTLIPFILYNGTSSIKTHHPWVQCARGVILAVAMTGWTYGLTIAHVTTATVISFTIPIFVMILASIFLDEKIIWQRWAVTIIVFIGLTVTLSPQSDDFNIYTLIFVISGILFASLDVINKHFIIKESMLTMLFYSASIAAIILFPIAWQEWVAPSITEYILLLCLGAGGNLLLFFILKAFSAVDATALGPFRYFELLVASLLAYLVFNEIPKLSTIIGSLIVIPSVVFIIYSENKSFLKKE